MKTVNDGKCTTLSIFLSLKCGKAKQSKKEAQKISRALNNSFNFVAFPIVFDALYRYDSLIFSFQIFLWPYRLIASTFSAHLQNLLFVVFSISSFYCRTPGVLYMYTICLISEFITKLLANKLSAILHPKLDISLQLVFINWKIIWTKTTFEKVIDKMYQVATIQRHKSCENHQKSKTMLSIVIYIHLMNVLFTLM